jgi:cysteine synthase A
MNAALTNAVVDTYLPALVPLASNLTAAVFPLMKLFPAELAIRRGRAEKRIEDGTLIIESSSGTMALALAVICCLRGERLTIVTDYACDDILRRRLVDLGATVEIVPAPARDGGYQRARLDRLHEVCRGEPRHFWVNQYDTPDNPDSYAPIADHLRQATGRIDAIVGTVGSGGSMCGIGRRLRERSPGVQLIGVDTFGSVLFGLPDAPRTLRGLGNSLLPRNLDHALFDEIHWVTAAEAYVATRALHRQTSLFRGGTSGACWLVARAWAAAHPQARVVCLCPDDGYRYVQTIYDDAYLRGQGLWLDVLPTAPRRVDHLPDRADAWTCMTWGRRRYDEVVAGAGMTAVRGAL